ncbi:MAG TPA: hypothetical protein ENJ82_05970 [Bacteroidetes bacterium]|nr:hypothetical protein [Bacteroidota bacterium]
MATIPIMIVFDGETIQEKAGTGGSMDHPISLGGIQGNCIYMMAQNNYVVSDQAGAELNISAEPEDIVQWRATSIDRTNYSPILVEFDVSSGSQYISTAVDTLPTLYYYLSKDANNPDSGTQQASGLESIWQATVLNTGSVTYHWTLKLMDREGNVIGYYNWDPFITIHKPG